MISGGVLGDFVKRRFSAGRVYVAMGSFAGFAIAIVIRYTTANKGQFFVTYAAATFYHGMDGLH